MVEVRLFILQVDCSKFPALETIVVDVHELDHPC